MKTKLTFKIVKLRSLKQFEVQKKAFEFLPPILFHKHISRAYISFYRTEPQAKINISSSIMLETY